MNGMKVVVKTDNRKRPTVSWYELPEKEKEYFDYGCTDHTFVKYKGQYHDLNNFMGLSKFREKHLDRWDDYSSDSFFSGVLVRWVDCDTVVMGTYIS
jgi:hypothetical protein